MSSILFRWVSLRRFPLLNTPSLIQTAAAGWFRVILGLLYPTLGNGCSHSVHKPDGSGSPSRIFFSWNLHVASGHTESGGWVFSQYVPGTSNTRTLGTVRSPDSPAYWRRRSEVGLSLPGESPQSLESDGLSWQSAWLDWRQPRRTYFWVCLRAFPGRTS